MKKIFSVAKSPINYSVGILLLRIVAGAGLMLHGWGKIQNPLGWMGEGSNIPAFLQALAAISEFVGGAFLILGLLMPLTCFGILCTMGYAVYKHAIIKGDPFVGKSSYELALIYFVITLL